MGRQFYREFWIEPVSKILKIMKTAIIFICIAVSLVNAGPYHPFFYGLGPICPEEVCTGCAEEGATDIKAIVSIDCSEGLADCREGAEDCTADAEDCHEPLKECRECLIGPGPCIHKNEINIGKCLAKAREGIATCLQENRVAVAKCVGNKRKSLAKADECLACAAGCEASAEEK